MFSKLFHSICKLKKENVYFWQMKLSQFTLKPRKHLFQKPFPKCHEVSKVSLENYNSPETTCFIWENMVSVNSGNSVCWIKCLHSQSVTQINSDWQSLGFLIVYHGNHQGFSLPSHLFTLIMKILAVALSEIFFWETIYGVKLLFIVK